MQIIVVTHAGRRTRSFHIRTWQLALLGSLAGLILFGGSVWSLVVGGADSGALQYVVDIWDGTRGDVVASKIGELSARIESLETVLDISRQDENRTPLQRQSLDGATQQAMQQAAIRDLESREGVLRAELERQLARREREARTALTRQLDLPVQGFVSSGFGWRTHPVFGEPAFHRGIDFSASAGTPVQAAAAGVVTFIGPAESYGKLVVISHGNRVQSRYAHLQGIEVTTGMALLSGERIGRVGSTGRSTGPHLHFELVIGDRVVNPVPFLGLGTRAHQLDAAST
jgi:murein DD-endopeptidase MepM/ murein hydrolase activator NlpD